MEEMNLCRQADTVNELLARYGVKFGIYKNGTFREQLFPFDAIPRVIGAEEFESLERGLKQRVMALNCYSGRKERVGAVYRRISDEYLDPMNFREDSVIGIPHIYDIYRKGNVALMNAPGNGVADDKGIYYFVPKMVKYYLGEEPILQNAPTYLPFYADDMQYTLEHFDDLVLKDVAEAGGYGVVFGSKMTAQQKRLFRI